MAAQDPLRLALELDSSEEPISGQLSEADGPVRMFSGWLGLFGALEAAAAEHNDHPEEER